MTSTSSYLPEDWAALPWKFAKSSKLPWCVVDGSTIAIFGIPGRYRFSIVRVRDGKKTQLWSPCGYLSVSAAQEAARNRFNGGAAS